jgi:hypothetical protein
MKDDEIGYVQGMNDLASPILQILNDESPSYWAFRTFMKRMRLNFLRDQTGIANQLRILDVMIKMMDPPLHEHLVNTGKG